MVIPSLLFCYEIVRGKIDEVLFCSSFCLNLWSTPSKSARSGYSPHLCVFVRIGMYICERNCKMMVWTVVMTRCCSSPICCIPLPFSKCWSMFLFSNIWEFSLVWGCRLLSHPSQSDTWDTDYTYQQPYCEPWATCLRTEMGWK